MTTSFQLIVFTLLMSLPPWHQDPQRETLPERGARMQVLAKANAAATAYATCTGKYAGDSECEPIWPRSRRSLAVFLVMKGWWESRYALHVHQDRCRLDIGECDGGRAKSPFQLQITHALPAAEWRQIGGTDLTSTKRATWAAAVVASRSLHRCKTIEGAIVMYGTGNRCDDWAQSAERYAYYRRLDAKFAAAQVAQKNEEQRPLTRRQQR